MAKSKSTTAKAMSTSMQTVRDARTSLLIVSILINAFIIVGFAILHMTTRYDAVLASSLLGR